MLENSRILVVQAANECSAKCLEALKYGRQEELELLSQELSKLNAAIDIIDYKLEALSISYKDSLKYAYTPLTLKCYL